MSTSNEHQHLFNQMDDAINDARTDDFDISLELMQQDLETIEREKIIVREIAARISHAEVLEPLLYGGDTPVTASDALSTLHTTLDTFPLSSEEKYAALQHLGTLLHIINDIESCQFDPAIFSKRETQTYILTTEALSHDDKSTLIDVTNALIEGPSIDINNPDDVLMAINKQEAEKDLMESSTATRRKLKVLIDNELLKFNISPDDPVYSTMTSLSIVYIKMDYELDAIIHSARKDLSILGISEEDYASAITTVIQKMNMGAQSA